MNWLKKLWWKLYFYRDRKKRMKEITKKDPYIYE